MHAAKLSIGLVLERGRDSPGLVSWLFDVAAPGPAIPPGTTRRILRWPRANGWLRQERVPSQNSYCHRTRHCGMCLGKLEKFHGQWFPLRVGYKVGALAFFRGPTPLDLRTVLCFGQASVSPPIRDTELWRAWDMFTVF